VSENAVSIAVIDGKTITRTQAVDLADNGKPVRIKAIRGGKYLLSEGVDGVAPENITIKRVGDDLHISLEGSSLDKPDLIIVKFYTQEGELVGLAEDGEYYPYVSSDAAQEHEAAFLIDGTSSAQALGANNLPGFGEGLVSATGGFWTPAMLGLGALGALGVLGAGLAIAKRGDGGSGGAGSVRTPNVPEQPVLLETHDDVGSSQGPILGGGYTDDTTPTFAGRGETPGNVIEIWDNDTKIGETTVGADGGWIWTPPPLGEGSHNIVIIEVGAGGPSEPSPGFEFVVDTNAPGRGSIAGATDDFGSVTGPILPGSATDDRTPTFHGTGEAGATAEIWDNGVKIGEAPIDDQGNWTFTPAAELSEGDHSIVVVVVDPATNVGLPSLPFEFEVDITAPGKPVTAPGGGLSEARDDVGLITGPIVPGGVTDDERPTFTGGGLLPGDTVSIIDNGREIGTVTVEGDGSWSWTPDPSEPLLEGGHSIVIVITDPAGNRSEPSDPYEFEIDTTAPVQATIDTVFDNMGDTQGPLAPGALTDDSTPTLGGTAEPGSKVTIHNDVDGSVLAEIEADGNGDWTWEPIFPLPNGKYELVVITHDEAGNPSTPSTPFPFEIVAGGTPPAPAITGVLDDVAAVTGNIAPGGVTNDQRPTVQGTGRPGDHVIITINGTEVDRVTVDAAGRWTFTPATDLGEGLNEITAQAISPGGNFSAETGVYPITLDSLAPDPAVVGIVDDQGPVQGVIGTGTGTTDDATPTIGGTAEPGTLVVVYDNGTPIGSERVADDGSWSHTPAPALVDGPHRITTTVTDAAGNTSAPSPSIDFGVDTSAVVISLTQALDDVGTIQGYIRPGGVTDDATPTLEGRGTPGALVTLYDNGIAVGSDTVRADGTWRITPTLAEGAHSFTATLTVAGVESAPTAAFAFDIDLTPPALPLIAAVSDDVGERQGTIANPGFTDDTTPTLSGTTEPFAIVEIFDNGTLIGTEVANRDGHWSHTPSELIDGQHGFTVVVIDQAGLRSPESAPYVITVDTQAPDQPTITSVHDNEGGQQGDLMPGDITDDATPTITGTAEAGSVVSVYNTVDGTLVGTVLADASGQWSLTPAPPLLNGAYQLSAIAKDAAGNASDPSDPFAVEILSGAVPVAPAITGVFDDVVSDVGNISPGGFTNDLRPTITGTAQAGNQVIVTINGVEVGRVEAQADGRWSITPTADLAQGLNQITAQAIDSLGNPSVETGVYPIHIDNVAPAPSSVLILDDQGPIQGVIDNTIGTTDDATPIIRGVAEPDTLVLIYDNGLVIGSEMTAADGSWTHVPAPALVDGSHTIHTTVTDKAGNTSLPSPATGFTVDTRAVEISLIQVVDDQGPVQGYVGQGGVTDDTTPTLEGRGTAGGVVTLYDNGRLIGTELVRADGTWSFTPTLGEGSYSFTATVTTIAAGESAHTAPFDFAVDLSRPSQPLITGANDDVGIYQGNIANGATTDDTTPTLGGTAEPGARIDIYDNGFYVGTEFADAAGHWSHTPNPPLGNGLHAFTVIATDPAGHSSVASPAYVVIVDTIAPGKLDFANLQVIDDVGAVVGAIANGGSTDDSRPTFNGSGQVAGDKITLIADGVVLGTAIADAAGHWTFTPEPGDALAEGVHNIVFQVTDAAGNAGTPSDPFTLTVDLTAPIAPTITHALDDVGSLQGSLPTGSATDDTTPTLVGTGEPLSVVHIYVNGDALPIGSVHVAANGSWTFPVPAQLEGNYTFTATATDAVGLVSPVSGDFDIEIDLTAPTTPVTGPGGGLGEAIDDVGVIVGPIPHQGITDDDRPTFTGGGLEPGDTVSIIDHGSEIGSAIVQPDGRWEWTPPVGQELGEGDHSIVIVITDPSGHASAPSDPYEFEVDLTAPNRPVITGVADDVGNVQGNLLPGATTDDASPVVSGTAEALSTVYIYNALDGRLLGSAPVDANGDWTWEPRLPLPQGAYELSVIAQDAAGLRSPVSLPFPLDISIGGVPSAPAITGVYDDVLNDIGNIAPGGVTNDLRPTVQGTAPAGQLVTVSIDGTVSGSVVAAADGSWSYTPNVDLAQGVHDITAQAVDANGQPGPSTGTYPITVDSIAPNPATVVITDDEGPIRGVIDNSTGTTDDSTPVISGTAEPGSVVTIHDNGVGIGSVAVAADGSWSHTPAPALVDGAHAITVTVTDKAGNVSTTTPATNFIVDTSAVVVSLTQVLDNEGAVQGYVPRGGVTDDTTPTLQGRATPGGLVTLYDNGVPVASVVAGADGSWSITPTLTEGVYAFTATVTTPGTGVSGHTPIFDLEVDTTGPALPVIGGVHDDVGLIQGSILNPGFTDDNTPTLSGTAEPGALVEIFDDGRLIGTEYADASGDWHFTPNPPLINGEHAFTVIATDEAGNPSPESAPYVITIDTDAPFAPVILSADDNEGPVRDPLFSGDVTDDTTPTLRGTGEADSLIHIYVVGINGPVGSAQVQSDGTWTFTVPARADGAYAFYAITTDLAGNVSPQSAGFDLRIDTTPPVAPVITHALDDQGSVQGQLAHRDATDDTTPTLVGTGEPLSIVHITLNGGTLPIGSVQVAANGSWSFTVPVQVEGNYTFTATSTDAVGLVSPVSGNFDLEIDLTAPTTPGIGPGNGLGEAIDDVGTITGPIPHQGSSDDSRPTFTGDGLEPGDTVSVIDNGSEIGTAIVQPDGSWEWTPPVGQELSEGDHSIVIVITDPAGNASNPSAPYEFEIDLTAPNRPAIVSADDNEGPVRDPLFSGDVTDDTTPTLRGTGEADSIVQIYATGTAISLGSAQVQPDGTWTFTVPARADGAYAFYAISTDPAGNVSPQSIGFDLTIDTTPPVAPVITHALDDQGSVQGNLGSGAATDDTTPTLVGTGEPLSIVHITLNGGALPIGSVQVAANGSWSFTVPVQVEGNYTFTATSTDAVGLVSPVSGTFDLEIDLTAPTTPGIGPGNGLGEAIDDVGTITGPIPHQGSSDDSRPTFTGDGLEPGDTVSIIDNGSEIGTAIVQPDGSWEWTPAVGQELSEGDHSIVIVITDPAGNASNPSAPYEFEIDLTAPNRPAITSATDNVGSIQGPLANGGVTDDTTPTLIGTGEADSIVQIYATGTAISLGSAQVQSDGTWTFTVPARADGAYAFYAISTDPAGNVSPQSIGFDLTIDTTPPVAPVITHALDDQGSVQGNLASGAATDDTTPTLVGTGEPLSIVHITMNGGTLPIGSVQVAADGSWSFTVPVQVEGNYTFTATATDLAGLVSPVSGTFDLEIDLTAPTTPGIGPGNGLGQAIDDVGTITGPIPHQGSTDDSRPTFTGDGLEPGDTVSVIDRGSEIGTAIVQPDGSWEWTPAVGQELGEGDHSIVIVITDPAGNASNPSAPYEFEIDLTAPNRPVIVSAEDDEGPIRDPLKSGDVTDDVTPTLIGTGEANSIVHIYVTGTAMALGSVQVLPNGTWTFTLPRQVEGVHDFYATSTDRVGHVSAPSSDFRIDIDTTVPLAPVITNALDDFGSIRGSITSGGVTDDSTPTLVGRGEVGTHVEIFDGARSLGTVQVGANGDWTFIVPAQPDGNYRFTAIAWDAAGLRSPVSNAWDVRIDLTAPVTPVTGPGGHLGEADDDVPLITGPIIAGSVTNDNRPTFGGAGMAPNDLVLIHDNGTLIGSALVAPGGAWTWTPPVGSELADGSHAITIIVRDPVGNLSPESQPYAFDVDTQAPATPTLDRIEDNVGTIKGDVANPGITDDTTPTLRGTGEAGSLISISNGTAVVGSVRVDASGNWVLTLPAQPDGDYRYSVTATDSAGNVSNASAAHVVTIDTQPPANPVITLVVDDAAPAVGDVPNLGTTNDRQPLIRGTAEALSDVTVRTAAGVILGVVQANAAGAWELQIAALSQLAEGDHVFIATASDRAGGVSGDSNRYGITVDVTPPPAPVITRVVDDVGTTTGNIAHGGTTDDTTPTLHGTAEANTRVQIYDGTALLGTAVVDGGGNWSYTTPVRTNGVHDFKAVGIDAASNTGPASNVWSVDVGTIVFGKGGLENFEGMGSRPLNAGDSIILAQTGMKVTVLDPGHPPGFDAGTWRNYPHTGINSREDSLTWNTAITEYPHGLVEYHQYGTGAMAQSASSTVRYDFEPTERLAMAFRPTSPGWNFSGASVGRLYDSDGVLVSVVRGNGYHSSEGMPRMIISAPAGSHYAYMEISTGEFPMDIRSISTGDAAYTYYYNYYQMDNLGVIHHVKPKMAFSMDEESASMETVLADEGIQFIAGSQRNEVLIKDEGRVLDFNDLTTRLEQAKPAQSPLDDTEAMAFGMASDGLSNDSTERPTGTANIQTVDITGTGDNVLRLSLDDVLAFGEADLFHDSEHDAKQMLVKGNEGDIVDLSGLVGEGDPGEWAAQGAVTVAGVVYTVYQHSSLQGELLVQEGVITNLV
jgi:hypothetical protein